MSVWGTALSCLFASVPCRALAGDAGAVGPTPPAAIETPTAPLPEPRTLFGLALGVVAVRVGSDEHQLQPAISLWGRRYLSPASALVPFVEPELVASFAAEGTSGSAGARLSESWLRGSVTLGIAVGRHPARVAVSLGPALTRRATSIDAGQSFDATSLQAGIRYRLGVTGLLLRGHLSFDALAGGSTRGGSGDQDLLLQAAWGF
jgi:hypothetical protein